MQNISLNTLYHTRCRAFRHFITSSMIVAFILGLTNAAIAQRIDEQPTVVLLSLSSQRSDVFWPEGEDRIADELRLSDMIVITTAAGAIEDAPESLVRKKLKESAQSDNASAAIVAYKTSGQNAHLFLYVKRTADNFDIYREYDIPLSNSQDETDITAFKVAELVQAMVDDMSNEPQTDLALQPPAPTAVETTPVPQPKQRKPLSKNAKRALVFAISGAATIGLGVVFHVKRNDYEESAGILRDDANDAYETGRYRDANDLNKDYETHYKKARAFNGAMITSYAIGGALLVVGFRTLLTVNKQKKTDNASSAFHMQGTNIVWDF